MTVNFPKYFSTRVFRAWYSVVSVVTRLLAGWSGVWIPAGRRKRFYFLKNGQSGSGAHPASYSKGTVSKMTRMCLGSTQPRIQWEPGCFSVVKRQVSEADLSPPSRTEITNEWSYTSVLPLCHHGVDKENSTFLEEFSLLVCVIILMIFCWMSNTFDAINFYWKQYIFMKMLG
jgi:hypothetical protein